MDLLYMQQFTSAERSEVLKKFKRNLAMYRYLDHAHFEIKYVTGRSVREDLNYVESMLKEQEKPVDDDIALIRFSWKTLLNNLYFQMEQCVNGKEYVHDFNGQFKEITEKVTKLYERHDLSPPEYDEIKNFTLDDDQS